MMTSGRAPDCAALATDSSIEAVGQAATGPEAVDLCWNTHPDTVPVAVRMSAMDGLSALRVINDRTYTIANKRSVGRMM